MVNGGEGLLASWKHGWDGEIGQGANLGPENKLRGVGQHMCHSAKFKWRIASAGRLFAYLAESTDFFGGIVVIGTRVFLSASSSREGVADMGEQ